MEYRIIGETLPAVEMKLQAGESVYTQSGGMAWMSDGLTLDSNVKGGLMKGLGRMFAGESLFMATYTATNPERSFLWMWARPALSARKGRSSVHSLRWRLQLPFQRKCLPAFLAGRALSFSALAERVWHF